MDNQALVDALIKFQSWCDNWPKIRAEIDAQAAELAALRERLAVVERDLGDAGMLVRRLCRRLPIESENRQQAEDWLRRKGLQGSILRTAARKEDA